MNPSDNNSFGEQGGQPIVSGGQDIGSAVLPTNKISNRGWLWILLVLGILAVIAIVVVAVIPRGSQTYTTRELFNKYANSFFFGTDGTQGFTMDGVEEGSIYFNQQLAEGFVDASYVAQLKNDFSNFREKYVDENENNEYAIDLFNNYTSELNLVTTYYNVGGMMIGDVTRAFLEGGEEGAREYVKSVADNYEDVGTIYGYDYYDLLARWGDGAVDLLNQYEEDGCLKEAVGIDYACAMEKDNSMISELSTEIGGYFTKMSTILNTSTDDVYTKIILMNEVLFNTEAGND